MTTRFLVLFTCFLPLACDKPAAVVPGSPAAVPAVRPAGRGVTLTSLATFSAGVATRLVATADGRTVYVCQSAGDGRDAVFLLRDGELPRATALTAGAAAAVFGLGGTSGRGEAASGATAGGAGGELQSLALLPGGKVAFYFSGTSGKRSASGVGVFDPRDDSLRVRATNDELARVAGLGGTLGLSQGTLVDAGGRLILWLDGVAGTAFLSFDAGRLASDREVLITRPFAGLTSDGASWRPGRGAWLSAGADDTLCLTLPDAGKVYAIDRDGRADIVLDLAGRPPLSTPPVYPGGAARTPAAGPMAFFPDDDILVGRTALTLSGPSGQTYPQLARPGVIEDRPLTRDDFHAAAGFPVYALRFTTLIRAGDDWIGYDETSGDVMRLVVSGR